MLLIMHKLKIRQKHFHGYKRAFYLCKERELNLLFGKLKCSYIPYFTTFEGISVCVCESSYILDSILDLFIMVLSLIIMSQRLLCILCDF